MSLKLLRKKAGLKQVAAAAQLGVTQSAVSQWETGTCKPRADLIPKMAQLYRCTADELLNASEGGPKQRQTQTGHNGSETEGNR